MSMSNYPGGFRDGISIRGVPLALTHPGLVFWVSNNSTLDTGEKSGSDGNDGSFHAPFATIDYAVGKCRANKGDVIFVKPGHAETIANATTLLLDVAGIAVIGLGQGTNRPTLTFATATTASVPVSAANVMVHNVLHIANLQAVVAAYTLTTAKDFKLSNCEFKDNSAILNFIQIVDTNATSNDADGLTLVDCNIYGIGTSASQTVVKMDGANARVRIEGCYTRNMSTTDGGAVMIVATGKALTDLLIKDNVFITTGVTTGAAGTLITIDTASTGALVGNRIHNLDATAEILVTAASGLKFFDNKSTAAADTSGYLLPVADA